MSEAEMSQSENDGEDVMDENENTDGEPIENGEAQVEIEIVKDVPLSKEVIAKGLSQLARTADGLSHAFVKMSLNGNELTSIEAASTYEHVRFVDVSENKIKSLSPLSSLEFLITIDAHGNQIEQVDITDSE